MCNHIVSDIEIEKAERAILPPGKTFNQEQRAYIKCLDSCYVQAYAGTGKTSCIVGKLHILAQKQVWKGGKGICVISHTNVAVDEIKKKVAAYYPEIMDYPNFIGTIQEFVNKFLFIPYLNSQGLKLIYQDEKRFNFREDLGIPLKERIKNHIRSKLSHITNNTDLIKHFNDQINTVFISNKEIYTTEGNSCIELFPNIAIKKFPHSAVIDEFSKAIKIQHESGRFLYVESFVYGYKYLTSNKLLSDIIRNRFEFVFLDEAQDCSDYQIKILEQLFSIGCSTVFQQVGDINQSITESTWKTKNPLYLGRSERFTPNLAAFLNHFKIDEGIGVTGNGTKSNVALYLLTYESGKEIKVLKEYISLVKNLVGEEDSNHYAISYKHSQLLRYFENYSERLARNKNKKVYQRFENDIDYIGILTPESMRLYGSNLVYNTLIALLYKYFKSGTTTIRDLKELLSNEKYEHPFKQVVIDVSFAAAKDIRNIDLTTIKTSLDSILEEALIDFSTMNSQKHAAAVPAFNPNNKFIYDGVQVNVGTIHSVKGQTHTSTLLFSNLDNRKSEFGHALSTTPTLTPRYKKLLYVASSRPTQLFAVAIENNLYDEINDKSIFSSFTKLEI